MNDYDKLISKVERKLHNYNQELDNYIRAKENIANKIKEKEEQHKKTNQELTLKQDILQKILLAEEEIESRKIEHKILIKLGIFLGVMFGIAAFGIASNYTSAIAPRMIAAFITAIISSGISIGMDTYRKNKEIEDLNDSELQFSSSEIQDQINKLQELLEKTESKKVEYQEKLVKKEHHIDFLTKAIAETYKIIESVTLAKGYVLKEIPFASEQKLNAHYQKDSKIEEILSLRRKKKQDKKSFGGNNG